MDPEKRQKAADLALEFLHRQERMMNDIRSCGHEVAILVEGIHRLGSLYYVPWNSAKCIETRDRRDGLVGWKPVLVDPGSNSCRFMTQQELDRL